MGKSTNVAAGVGGKRLRRSRAELDRIKEEIMSVVRMDKPMTLRQIFYRLVPGGHVPKDECGYDLVGRLLKNLRKSKELPYEWIIDNTRSERKPLVFASPYSAIAHRARSYRRDLWSNQDVLVQIWLEKDAVSGTLEPITWELDVSLNVCRGFSSLTFLKKEGDKLARENRPIYIYYFGDYDPSGIDVPIQVEAGLREFAPHADITFIRQAVNEDQIEEFNLPTRLTKRSDSRSKNFGDRSVDVDAIAPSILKQMCRRIITQHIDQEKWAEGLRQQEEDKAALLRLSQQWRMD